MGGGGNYNCVAMGVNQTFDDHFTIYTNIESLCCTSKVDIRLYVNYITIKKNSSYPTQANLQRKKAD